MMVMLEKLCSSDGMAQRTTIDGESQGAHHPRLNIREKRAIASTFTTFARVEG
jgi:hypothetical protein